MNPDLQICWKGNKLRNGVLLRTSTCREFLLQLTVLDVAASTKSNSCQVLAPSSLIANNRYQLYDNTFDLLDLGFCIHHMFADNRIKLFDLHFIRHVALVFISGVEVASACT